MATIDLRALSTDDFVLHFGGRTNEVNAFTFANSLLALSEAMRDINAQINPDFNIEIVIDSVGSGSFRARLKTRRKSVATLLKGVAKDVIVGVLAAYIYERTLAPPTKIIVNDDSYVVEHGGDKIILPKEVYEARKRIHDTRQLDVHIGHAFEALEEDPSVTDFGITPDLADKEPLAPIPREKFASLATASLPIVEEDSDGNRVVEQDAKVVIIRAVLERSNRKWQFVWGGIKISASIKDEDFFNKLARHEYVFGQGDILDVVLRIYQERDEMSRAWLNTAYEIVEVRELIPCPKQTDILERQMLPRPVRD